MEAKKGALLSTESVAFVHTYYVAGKNKKKVKSSAKKGKGTGLPRPYAREITLYQGYGCICAGYFKVSSSGAV